MSQQAAVAADALHTPADQVRVNRHRADWRGWKFMWPFALVFVFVFVIPILYAIYISFFQKQMIGGTKFVGISNYIRLFHDQQFWSSVGRVALFTCVQVPIMLFLSAAMALMEENTDIEAWDAVIAISNGISDPLIILVQKEIGRASCRERV